MKVHDKHYFFWLARCALADENVKKDSSMKDHVFDKHKHIACRYRKNPPKHQNNLSWSNKRDLNSKCHSFAEETLNSDDTTDSQFRWGGGTSCPADSHDILSNKLRNDKCFFSDKLAQKLRDDEDYSFSDKLVQNSLITDKNHHMDDDQFSTPTQGHFTELWYYMHDDSRDDDSSDNDTIVDNFDKKISAF